MWGGGNPRPWASDTISPRRGGDGKLGIARDGGSRESRTLDDLTGGAREGKSV